jgi:hypothetical protein
VADLPEVDENVVAVLGVRVADDPEVFSTTPRFNGYPAVLVWLDRIEQEGRTARAYLDR